MFKKKATSRCIGTSFDDPDRGI